MSGGLGDATLNCANEPGTLDRMLSEEKRTSVAGRGLVGALHYSTQ
jgi:hypothetical protein